MHCPFYIEFSMGIARRRRISLPSAPKGLSNRVSMTKTKESIRVALLIIARSPYYQPRPTLGTMYVVATNIRAEMIVWMVTYQAILVPR